METATFDTIVRSLLRASPRSYTPAFRVERQDGSDLLFDGDRPLARFYRDLLDIWAFSPFDPDIKANSEPPGEVVDLHTAHNTVLNFGSQTWPSHWAGTTLRWDWEVPEGRELVAVVSLDAREGETARWRLTTGYDPARAQYTWRITLDARKMDPDGFEGFNLMTAGALEDRPEKRRWTHSLWEGADGVLRRMVHSNALLKCTDYANLRSGDGPWRGRNLSYPRTWIAYAAHPVFNPALLVRRASCPLWATMCDQLFDGHILFSRAGLENLGEDGYFHYHLDLDFVNLPAALARDLLQRAADPVRPKKWWNEKFALAFRMDAPNSFEEAVDPWQPEDCPILEIPRGDGGAVSWASDAAHGGARSIRLRQAQSGRVALSPSGAVCKVKLRTRYRLSAWVKTKGVTAGSARLELAGYAYTENNVSHEAKSGELRGDHDWTRLDVVLDSRSRAYLLPSLVLDGSGAAWFDDVCLEEAT